MKTLFILLHLLLTTPEVILLPESLFFGFVKLAHGQQAVGDRLLVVA